jgi:hypothetical protein
LFTYYRQRAGRSVLMLTFSLCIFKGQAASIRDVLFYRLNNPLIYVQGKKKAYPDINWMNDGNGNN